MNQNHQQQTLYSQLPAIDHLLNEPALELLLVQYGSTRITQVLRQLQAQARAMIRTQQQLPDWCRDWPAALQQALLQQQRSRLQPVFNLSGTVLHTNLGRAVLPESAISAVAQTLRMPVTLEYDLGEAERGHRDQVVKSLLCELTGAEDVCIVNNNAAAVLLLLAALAAGRQVIVSRGELVEIGGAFRIPDVMRQAGCQLVEVGTTNRTHLKDYRQAINSDTALLMKVHTSNYHIAGFTAAVDEAQLVLLGQEQGIATVTDLGSGSLIDMTTYGLPAEPMPRTLLAAGVDLVTFSGDKLLGGPQAGIIVGKKQWIEQLQRHPLKRALRVDKMTLAALEATLRLYQQPEFLSQQLPTLRFLTRSPSDIQRCAERLLPSLHAHYGDQFIVSAESCASQIGSGSLPVDRLPSWAITFAPRDGRGASIIALADRWRRGNTPVIGRISEGKLWLDLRCLEDEATLLRELIP